MTEEGEGADLEAELEALTHTFDDALSIDKAGGGVRVSVLVVPRGAAEGEQLVEATLRLTATRHYPAQPPEVGHRGGVGCCVWHVVQHACTCAHGQPNDTACRTPETLLAAFHRHPPPPIKVINRLPQVLVAEARGLGDSRQAELQRMLEAEARQHAGTVGALMQLVEASTVLPKIFCS
jgi:hypothetical protein